MTVKGVERKTLQVLWKCLAVKELIFYLRLNVLLSKQ